MSHRIGVVGLVLLVACSEPQEKPPLEEMSSNEGDSYSQVLPGRAFSFPEDHLAHPGFRQEWWYLTANLRSDQGESLGLQWTQFRIAMAPDHKAVTGESSWATDQLYMAHSAVTTKSHHLAQEKWSRQHPQLAGVQAEPFTVKLDDWQWRSEGASLFPAQLKVKGDEFSYSLTLKSHSPMQLQGEQGYSRKIAEGKVASYYYSQPFIEVTGEIEMAGQRHRVSGEGWLDREWSSQALGSSQQGWDWFALRLNDGSALMLYQLRDKEDEQEHFISARRMYPDGRGYAIPSAQIQMSATGYHPIDGRDHPVAWHITIPTEQLDIDVKALNPDAKMPLTVAYWEGPIEFSGSHTGVGYMEMTGY